MPEVRHNGANGHQSPKLITKSQGWQLLEREAQRSLGISANQFIKQWNRGDFKSNPDRPEVMRVAMLLPLAR